MKTIWSVCLYFTFFISKTVASEMGGGCDMTYYYQLYNGSEKTEVNRFGRNSVLTFNIHQGDSLQIIFFWSKTGFTCSSPITPLTNLLNNKGDTITNFIYKKELVHHYTLESKSHRGRIDSISVIITMYNDIPKTFTSPTHIKSFLNKDLVNSYNFTDINKLGFYDSFKLNKGDTIFISANNILRISSESTYYLSEDRSKIKLVDNGNFSISLKNGLGDYGVTIYNPSQPGFLLPCPNYIIATGKLGLGYGRFPIPIKQSKIIPKVYHDEELNIRVAKYADCKNEIDSLKIYQNIQWFYSFSNPDSVKNLIEWNNEQIIKIQKSGFYKCKFLDNDTSYNYTFYYLNYKVNEVPNAVDEREFNKTNISIAPNPVLDYLNISSNIEGDYFISDCLGNIVCIGSLLSPTNSIEVSHLQRGIYTFSVSGRNKIYHRKFIK